MADANAAPPLENDAQGTAAVYYVTDAPPPNEVSADLSLDGWINAMQSNQINNINNNNSGGRSDGGTAAPSTASPGPTNRRARRNSVGPVTCQVPACGKTLDGTTPKYFSKHRVCEEHGKASQVDGFADGVSRRFCQQCSRFHELEKFEGDKRSCAESLRIHGERRVERYKKRKVEKMEEAARKAPMTSAGATPARPGTLSGLTLPSLITSTERNVAPHVPTVSPHHDMPPSERNVVPDVPTVSPHYEILSAAITGQPSYTAPLPAPPPPPLVLQQLLLMHLQFQMQYHNRRHNS
uniref:SBP-type domain-containing protein n=1 Tax=Pycnococcus provasolii TaxID=41880 RepID=A0A7S2YWB2_9CHLO